MYATQLNHLLQRGAHATSLAAVLVARPNAEERDSKGQLALLLEVPGNSARQQVAVNEFLKHVEASYYNGPASEPEASLEQALRYANANLGQVAGLVDKRWPEKTTMVVFVHHGDQVFFATAGSAWGVLLTPQRVASITDSGSRHANVNPLKPFSAISSGPLQPDSVACFASLTLLDYIAQEKFRKLVWELPPLGVVQRLEELLGQASPQLNIMALIIRRMAVGEASHQAQAEAPAMQPSAPASQQSLHQLASRRSATAQLMSVPSLRQSLGSKLGAAASTLGRGAKHLASPATWTTAGARVRRSLLVARTAVSTKAQRVAATSSYWWPPSAWLTAAALGVSRTIRWVKQISVVQRAILGVLALACVGLATGLSLQAITKASHASNLPAGFAASVSASIDDATNSLIYGDEQHAAQAVAAAEQQLASLTARQRADASLEPIQQRLSELRAKLSKSIAIGSLPVVATFPDQTTHGIAIAGSSVWTITGAGLVRIDSATGSTTVAANGVGVDDRIGGEAKLAYAASASSVTVVSGLNVSNLSWQRLAEDTAATAIAPYNGKLYSVSPSGQVFRYQRSGQDFNAGASWLKQQPTRQNPVGIAVDGSVYVLQPDSIQKFNQGNPASFTLSPLYPQLSQAASFSVQTKSIYVLEPASQRIAIFSKTGQLDRQYTSPDLANATAIAVDTAERTAYVSAGATVLKIDLAAR